MARRPTSQDYQDLISTLVAEGEGGTAIIKRVEEFARANGRDDYPAERAIYYIAAKCKKLPEAVLQEQARFRWPRSLELRSTDLPWEAVSVVLAFVRFCYDNDSIYDLPTVRQCKWFWRLHLAAPNIPLRIAVDLALDLSAFEFVRVAKLGEAKRDDFIFTRFLTYQPWLDKEHRETYIAREARLGLQAEPIPTIDYSGDEAVKAMLYEKLNKRTADVFVRHLFSEEAGDGQR